MRLSRSASVALLVAVLIPALAWKGGSSAGVVPIAQVLEKAESGDVVSVQGRVIDSTTASGSLLIAIVQDETGQVPVAVPDSLIRKLEVRQGEAAGGQRYRVTGRWDHKHMDADTWGIYAQEIERLDAR